MRIAIDASSAAIEHKTGVAKYIEQLIEHLEEVDSDEGNAITPRAGLVTLGEIGRASCRERV